jgi:DNA-binding transcriptional regulator YiaG
MGKMENTFRSEVIRLAQKEIRAVLGPLTSEVRELKKAVSSLKKAVAALEKPAKEWVKQVEAEKADLTVPEQEAETARLSPLLIRKLRKRLGLSQGEMATVLEISPAAVGFWEQGKSRPTGANRTALVALRKLGKRDVQNLLASKQPAEPKATPKKKAGRKSSKPAK